MKCECFSWFGADCNCFCDVVGRGLTVPSMWTVYAYRFGVFWLG